MKEVHRTGPFFYAEPAVIPRDEDYYQPKAMVYFHLSLLEEIYLAGAGSSAIAELFEREGRKYYIIRKMRHPLIREVFDEEAECILSTSFTQFVKTNRKEIGRAPTRMCSSRRSDLHPDRLEEKAARSSRIRKLHR